jgi:hypothetical protein
MNRHFVEKNTLHGRPKREGLDYIRSLAQETMDFQSSKNFKKPAVGKYIILGRISSPWATVPDYTNYQSLAALGGSAD